MGSVRRRTFLQASAAGALWAGCRSVAISAEMEGQVDLGSNLHLATFRFDVTPPVGHSLCGGWIKPVEGVDDPLEAIGFVLSGMGPPVVICAVDWCGLLNGAHQQWRAALSEAAGTSPDRVAVQCVHQHNAPFACLEAEQFVEQQGDLPHILDRDFFRTCLDRARDAVRTAKGSARPVTHVARGEARVDQVASNRRVYRSADGRVLAMRGSSCRDPQLQQLPEGLIDPLLKTVAFYDGDQKLAACHYYATHPMSYYGDGRVTSDFVGLARKQRQQDEPGCAHLYFTGCAGDIAAGKYNNGTPEMRPALTRRIYEALVASERNMSREPIASSRWRTYDLLPPPRGGISADQLAAQVADRARAVVDRNRPSFQLAWFRRLERKEPVALSALELNDVTLLHLPSEVFIEYQLRAQRLAPGRFVATAAYGDGGPWYIPTAAEYPAGGYEVGVAFCDPQVDPLLTAGIERLVG